MGSPRTCNNLEGDLRDRQSLTATRRAGFLAIAAAIFTSLSLATMAIGQDDEGAEEDAGYEAEESTAPRSRGRVEEIVITAQKREQNIQEVPISVTALTSEFVQDSGLTEFGGIQQYAPNVSVNPIVDTRSTAIRIRGIGADQSNAGIDAAVGVFIDGIYQGRTGLAAGAGLLDIERIEVLRGPQGTLFGKNTAAGAFNITTKKPDFDDRAAMLEVVYGKYNQHELRGWINLPIFDDRIATRIAGYVTRRGFFDRNLSGGGRNDADTNGFRWRTLFDVSDNLEFLLSADYGTSQNTCCAPDIVTYQGPPSLDVTFGPFDAPEELFLGSLAESTGRPLPAVVDPFDRIVDADADTRNSTRYWGISTELNYDIGEHSIKWLTGHRRFDSDSLLDGDFSGYDAILLETDEKFYQWSTEIQLVSPGGEDFEYVIGAYHYFQKDLTLGKISVLPEWRAVGSPVGLVLDLTADENGEAFNRDTNTHRTWSYALFGQGTYHFNDEWSLTVGVRGTHERKAQDGSQIATLKIDAGPFGPDRILNEEPLAVYNVSPMAVLHYNVTEDAMLFGKFARGFKSGGFNQQRTPEGVSTRFEDEEATDFELGARTTWLDRMLTANITGFYTIYDEFQAQGFDGTALTVTNAGKLTSAGLEADMFLAPHETTVIGAALGWNIAEYDTFPNSPCTADQTWAARLANSDPSTPAFCEQDLAGRQLDNAPRWTSSFFTQYINELSDFGFFDAPLLGRLRLEYSYRDFIYLAQDLEPNLTQGPTHLLNLRAGIEDDGGRWQFALWSQNTLDEKYAVVGIDTPITSGYGVINGPPLQWGFTLRAFF